MTKETKKEASIVTEKQFIDLTNAGESAIVIKDMLKTGVTSALKSYRMLQSVAVNALRHVEKHRNVNVLNDVITVLQSAQIAPKKMNDFILKFAPVTYSLAKKSYVLGDGQFNITGAMQKPWWKVGAPETINEYSDEQLFAIAVSRMTKKRASTKDDPKAKFNDVLYQKAFNLAKEYDLVSDDSDSVNEEESEQETSEERNVAQAA